MNKTIEIKKSTIRNIFISIIIGFSALYGIEHLGTFSYLADSPPQYDEQGRPYLEYQIPATTKVSKITYKTYFGNLVETEGNGFDVYDLNYAGTEFNKYSSKSYYYTQAILKDFKYGLFISLILFLISLFFTTFKIKLS
ncbi:hypothetical protein LPB87_06470 [Flavobacterium sp. EDS]|uniref:hypothetical protein n=1 Tax=Flavobacterium sp. EDS TaxID=2897328 RepID=UPI001E3D11D1|nr:hypothetical protein [Flavobacterium sp. EDS]MCD0474036.1 hypothetical protein [Flavobacterium sp. EDS]